MLYLGSCAHLSYYRHWIILQILQMYLSLHMQKHISDVQIAN